MIKLKFNIVLIAPLDWGLGHVTRCIPVIKLLHNAGCKIIVACNIKQQQLLQNEFKSLHFLQLEGYNITYANSRFLMPFKILSQLPSIQKSIKNEQEWLQKVIIEYQVDLVISDNRFGLYTSKVPCIFITHQLTIKAPFSFLERWLQAINYSYINRYNACWLPDCADEPNIAGLLSHPKKMPLVPVDYIGPLSRINKENLPIKYNYCIVLSGPEPQRTALEKLVLKNIHQLDGNTLLIRGKPNLNEEITSKATVTIKNHLPAAAMQAAFNQSEYIISRSGYSTIMELLVLQKKSILIPTPGQTEQEYLGKKLMDQHWAFTIFQPHFNLLKAVDEAKFFNYQLPIFTNNDLEHNIITALEKL